MVPFLASFYARMPFYKKWKPFFVANMMVAAPFLIWDAIFTDIGVWGFNPNYLTGYSIYNLPIEEVLFFVCIPYACVFTYYALRYLTPNHLLKGYQSIIILVFTIITCLFMILGYDRLYTFYTGLFTFVFVAYLWLKKIDITDIVLSYLVIFPFFLISNGLLTGSFLEEPIVWYNNAENLSIRMWTIPVEDSIYGFLLIGLNIVLCRWFDSRKLKN